MPAVAIFTLVLVALLVAALAFYLIWVILILNVIINRLGHILRAVRTIGERTEPVAPIMTDINANLGSVADALEDLVARATRSVRPPATTP